MSAADISEKGLEDIIVDHLVGANGFEQGSSDDYLAAEGVDWARMLRYLKATQPKAVERLQLETSEKKRGDFLNRLGGELAKRGVIDVLRKGFNCYPVVERIYLYSVLPSANNPKSAALYAENVFSVTRQLRHLGLEKGDAVDLCLFLNGLPILTCELKNQYTNQNWRDAEKQYRDDRNPAQCVLFRFKRCMAHFAVDDNEVRFQTKLEGKATKKFLPFNKGFNQGAGNPPNPNGLRTAYFWEETLTKASLSNIIENYAQVVVDENKKTKAKVEKQIFPRYHQLACVRSLLADVRKEGVGQRYLIQHSAGSGKSNSIAWLVHQLAGLQDGEGHPVLDSVVVITDRVNLDKQIRDTIKSFMQVESLVGWAQYSGKLKSYLEGGKRIIVTTIHKFGIIHDEMSSALKDRKFAIVIDEAHSSQSGDMAAKMNETLSGSEADAEEDAEQKILRIMESRQLLGNASYFAFTATPKNKTLEMFGRKVSGGDEVRFEPFHVYTMKQAIEEEFILDVLKNYVPYSSFYRIAKTIEGNPKFDKDRALKKISSYVQSATPTIERKAAVIVDHFHDQVAHLLGGEARAMVVCKDIERAIRYFAAINKFLDARKSPYKAVVAFSGEKEVDGEVVSEEKLNGFPSKDIEDTFASGNYRLLVVANKFQTGYDEPLLCAMYVDKKLADIQAVQTLSRLNRACPPKKNRVFVLDFANNVDSVKSAFAEYYRDTVQEGETDPNRLFELQEYLKGTEVFSADEVEGVSSGLLEGVPRQSLDAVIDPCVDRYKLLSDDDKIKFKGSAKKFLRMYSFLGTILPVGNPEWERLYIFLKLLVTKLPSPDDPGLAKGVIEAIDLDSYRLQAGEEMDALEDRGKGVVEPQQSGPAHGRREPVVEKINRIIEEFNSLFGNIPWSNKDRVIEQLKSFPEHVASEEKFANAVWHAGDDAAYLESNSLLEKLVLATMTDGIELFKQYTDVDSFKIWLQQQVFDLAKAKILERTSK